MPASTKTELDAVTRKEFAKLEQALASVPEDVALLKDEDDTSIKDIVAHRAHWIELFMGWYADGQAGKPVCFPAKGYKWNDLKRYNSDLRDRQKDLSWDRAKRQLATRHEELLSFIQGKSDRELYGGPMAGAKNNWAPGRWAEAAGPSHYRSATKYIRARLRSLP